MKMKKITAGEYQVIEGGQLLGTVFRSWHRLGGRGWAHSEHPSVQAGKTLREAVTDLRRHRAMLAKGLINEAT